MQYVELRSHVIRSVFYDAATQRLALQKRTRGLEFYESVPPDIFEALISDPAPGQFYKNVIRAGWRPNRGLHPRWYRFIYQIKRARRMERGSGGKVT